MKRLLGAGVHDAAGLELLKNCSLPALRTHPVTSRPREMRSISASSSADRQSLAGHQETLYPYQYAVSFSSNAALNRASSGFLIAESTFSATFSISLLPQKGSVTS